MFKIISILVIFNSIFFAQQLEIREEINFPDILNYTTLKGDFHMHSVFSDGNVWPNQRVDEAWREGYDVIALTDHIEYQPKKRLPKNRS